MPFVLIIAGVVLIISAVRNTQQQLFYLLALDFTGPHNFIFWFLSILLIGALGYIPKAKPLSDGFLILVILVLFLKKGTGFFDMFQKQIGTTQNATPNVSTGQPGQGFVSTSSGGITIGGGSGGGIVIGGGGGGASIGFPGSGGVGFPGGGNSKPFGCDPFWDPTCIGGGFNGPYNGLPSFIAN
jgi:hypothetical protein